MEIKSIPIHKALQVLVVPVVRWSVRLGIGYRHFNRLVKPLFFAAAQREADEKGIKPTAAALSLISGLSKNDIDSFKASAGTAGAESPLVVHRINPASQVVARWVALDLPKRLPIKGDKESFFGLVKAVQAQFTAPGMSARLLLQDLDRRGMVQVDDQTVELLSEVGQPHIEGQDCIHHFVGAVRDHMDACLANLKPDNGGKCLEQCLQADGLSAEAVETIHALARVWWMQAMRTIGPEAISLSERDEPNGGSRRLRLGVYFYTEDTTQASQPYPTHSL